MSLEQVFREEIELSRAEGRDFSFSSTQKAALLAEHGLDAMRDTLIREIRRVDMPCIDPFDNEADVSSMVAR